MIFSTVLAAAGLTPPLDATTRRAKVFADQAKLERDRAAAEQRINESRSELNAKARKDIERVQAEADAFETKLSAEIAADLRKKLVPLLLAYSIEPTRKAASAIKSALYQANQEALVQLGCPLDHVLLCTVFVDTLISAEPSLIAAFHDISSLHGEPISAATRLLACCDGDYITDFEAALSDLEQALERAAKTLPRSPVTDEHEASYATLCAHASPAQRAHATQSLTLEFANQRAAKIAADYRAPVSVESSGGVDVNGREWARSVVTYEPVQTYSPVATIPADGVDTVERGFDSV